MPATYTRGVSRLTIRINGIDYVILPLGIHNGLRSYQIRKKDKTGNCTAVYTIQEFRGGCSCDCPDFATRRTGRNGDACKHIRAMKNFYLVF